MTLRRKAPMKRTGFKRKASGKSAYRRRERDPAYMAWVSTLPCELAGVTPCGGRIEVDHAGERAFGSRAADRTCIPLCARHHRERTNYFGFFKNWTGAMMRVWCDDRIRRTQKWYADIRTVATDPRLGRLGEEP